LSLPKYHVYLEYEKDKEKPSIRFNLSEEELMRIFVTPYSAGKPFWFCGKLLSPSKVERVIIFWSNEDCGKLVLPNREEVANHPDKKFVMDYILRGKVKGVQICTDKFLTPPQKKE
jgi:hypothetical protein